MKSRRFLKTAFFQLTVAAAIVSSCGSPKGNEGLVDLSPYLGSDGLYSFSVKNIPFTLTPVQGGTFSMGETFEQGVKKNPDIHQVILDGFAIGTAEVTQELWKAVMGSNPSPKDVPGAPVSGVTYENAVKFVEKLAKITGVPFRLPTEAEWEFAARGGNKSQRTLYSGGNELKPSMVNELGIKAMSGGVWEWCSDKWTENLGDELAINPVGPSEGIENVLRGGSAADSKSECIISSRKGLSPKTKSPTAGLRLAVSTGEKCPQAIVDLIEKNIVPRDPVTELKEETFKVGDVFFRMLPVEGGSFMMGATQEHEKLAKDDEKPVHKVTLDSFMIGEFEVTCELWKAVMGYLPPYLQGDGYPVGNVSWYDAQSFIAKLNALTGRKFRLPTEAEWEYAARGGKKTKGYPFAGAMRSDVVAVKETKDLKPVKVGTRFPNELGTYDMSGNVWEWCQDRFAPYSAEDSVNPVGPEKTESGLDYRVMRGGSAAAFWDKCRTANRSENKASLFKSTIGFRLAL